jgi:hypothetical protein
VLITALILGLLIYAGVFILYRKLPKVLRNAMCKADLLLDVGLSVGAFFALGQTVTALIASAILGIILSLTLFFRKRLERFKARPRNEAEPLLIL